MDEGRRRRSGQLSEDRRSRDAHERARGGQKRARDRISQARRMNAPRTRYLHHRIECDPLAWDRVAKALASNAADLRSANGQLYGVWRSQIGQPRDTLNAITVWDDDPRAGIAFMELLN